jgi:hypothetical protein
MQGTYHLSPKKPCTNPPQALKRFHQEGTARRAKAKGTAYMDLLARIARMDAIDQAIVDVKRAMDPLTEAGGHAYDRWYALNVQLGALIAEKNRLGRGEIYHYV